MTHHNARLEVDQLGDRILPSVTTLSPPVKPAKVVVGPQAPVSALSGTVHGSYVRAPTAHNLGPEYAVRASGTITGLGSVTVTGLLSAPKVNATGEVTGLLLIRTARGSVTVSLTSASQSGRAGLPTLFQYKIVAGSGEFFGSTGQGTAHLTLGGGGHSPPTLSLTF